MTTENTGGGLSPEQEAMVRGDGLELPPDPFDTDFSADSSEEAPSEPTETVEETPAAPTQEAPAAPEPESEPDSRGSEQLARLARAEAQLRKEKEDLARQREELKTFMELAETAKKGSKLDLLDRLGVSYDDITNEYISGAGPTPESKIKSEIEQLREQTQRELEEIRQYTRAQQLEKERQFLRERVEAAEDLPVVRGLEAYDLVESAVQSHYREHGEIVSYEDAARAVEGSLLELFDKAMSIPAIQEKYRQRFTSDSGKSRTETKREESARTLSNEVTQERTLLVEDDFDPITADDEDLIERLAPMLKYND